MIGRTKDISIQKNHQDELLLGFVVVFFSTNPNNKYKEAAKSG